jgi:very-short-patch-repair endonuclease
VYRLPGGDVAVFVDGPDDADRPGRDEDAAEELRDAGWNVIRVRYGADYTDTVARYPSVFGISGRERR